jgi:hypothetical protein
MEPVTPPPASAATPITTGQAGPRLANPGPSLPAPNLATGIGLQTMPQWEAYITAHLRGGMKPEVLLGYMAAAGAPQQEAYWLMHSAVAALRKEAGRTMLIGGGSFLAAVAITFFTYSMASSGGGTYFVWWGLMLFGIVYFVKGLIAWVKLPSF